VLGAPKAATILGRSQLRLRFTPGATPCRWLPHESLRASRAALSVPRLPRRELRLARARCATRDVQNSTWFAAAHALQALPALVRRHPRDRVLPAAALTLGFRRRRRAACGGRLASCDRACARSTRRAPSRAGSAAPRSTRVRSRRRTWSSTSRPRCSSTSCAAAGPVASSALGSSTRWPCGVARGSRRESEHARFATRSYSFAPCASGSGG